MNWSDVDAKVSVVVVIDVGAKKLVGDVQNYVVVIVTSEIHNYFIVFYNYIIQQAYIWYV